MPIGSLSQLIVTLEGLHLIRFTELPTQRKENKNETIVVSVSKRTPKPKLSLNSWMFYLLSFGLPVFDRKKTPELTNLGPCECWMLIWMRFSSLFGMCLLGLRATSCMFLVQILVYFIQGISYTVYPSKSWPSFTAQSIELPLSGNHGAESCKESCSQDVSWRSRGSGSISSHWIKP